MLKNKASHFHINTQNLRNFSKLALKFTLIFTAGDTHFNNTFDRASKTNFHPNKLEFLAGPLD